MAKTKLSYVQIILKKKVGTQNKEKRAINKNKILNCDMTGENLFCVLAHSCFFDITGVL